MKKEILIILPSRSNGSGRETNVERFIDSWRKYSEGQSDLCVLLDDDDDFRYRRHSDVKYVVNPNMRFVPKVNKAALEFKDHY